VEDPCRPHAAITVRGLVLDAIADGNCARPYRGRHEDHRRAARCPWSVDPPGHEIVVLVGALFVVGGLVVVSLQQIREALARTHQLEQSAARDNSSS
jgi:hypothetical protein